MSTDAAALAARTVDCLPEGGSPPSSRWAGRCA